MVRFRKVVNFKIISLLVTVVFILNSSVAYAIDLSLASQKSHLRKVLDFEVDGPEVVRYLAVAIGKSIQKSLPDSSRYISIEHTPLRILRDIGRELDIDLIDKVEENEDIKWDADKKGNVYIYREGANKYFLVNKEGGITEKYEKYDKNKKGSSASRLKLVVTRVALVVALAVSLSMFIESDVKIQEKERAIVASIYYEDIAEMSREDMKKKFDRIKGRYVFPVKSLEDLKALTPLVSEGNKRAIGSLLYIIDGKDYSLRWKAIAVSIYSNYIADLMAMKDWQNDKEAILNHKYLSIAIEKALVGIGQRKEGTYGNEYFYRDFFLESMFRLFNTIGIHFVSPAYRDILEEIDLDKDKTYPVTLSDIARYYLIKFYKEEIFSKYYNLSNVYNMSLDDMLFALKIYRDLKEHDKQRTADFFSDSKVNAILENISKRRFAALECFIRYGNRAEIMKKYVRVDQLLKDRAFTLSLMEELSRYGLTPQQEKDFIDIYKTAIALDLDMDPSRLYWSIFSVTLNFSFETQCAFFSDSKVNAILENMVVKYSSLLTWFVRYGNKTEIIKKYFSMDRVPNTTGETWKFISDLTIELSKQALGAEQERGIINFYKAILATSTIDDYSSVLEVFNVLSSAKLDWLRQLDKEVEEILGLENISAELTAENFFLYARIYEIYNRFAKVSGVKSGNIENRLKNISRDSIDEKFVNKLVFKDSGDFALAINFISRIYKDQDMASFIFEKASSFIGADARIFSNHKEIETIRLKFNEVDPVLGDRWVINLGTGYVKNNLNLENLHVSDLENAVALGEGFRNSNVALTRDVRNLYKLIGNFIFGGILNYINQNLEEVRDELGEDILDDLLQRLMKHGFFMDEEDSAFQKIWQHIKSGNIRYLTHKAQVMVSTNKKDLGVTTEKYKISPSSEYQLEEGCSILEMKEKGKEDILAYILRVDPKKGGRLELSADVGRIHGGISGESLRVEIGHKGRLILDAPVSFTTGDAKPTEILIEDGNVENYLISTTGKDGFIIVYPDRTVHIADKRDLWMHDVFPSIPSYEDKRLDIVHRLEDYIQFIELCRDTRISLVSNMLLYDGERMAELKDREDQRRLFVEFSDGSFGIVNPTERMSTYAATQLAIIAGATKVVYMDTGQFDYTTFRPLNGAAVVWGDSDQKESSNRIGIYHMEEKSKEIEQQNNKKSGYMLNSLPQLKGIRDKKAIDMRTYNTISNWTTGVRILSSSI